MRVRQVEIALLSITALICGAAPYAIAAAESVPQIQVDKDGTVHASELTIPFSSLASAEARRAFIDRAEAMQEWNSDVKNDGLSDAGKLEQFILQWRKDADAARKKTAEEMIRIFPVNLTEETIGGVKTDVVMPREGVSPQNAHRVLINLHGGGMVFGARYEGQVMSIPIASLGRIKVITVDYRLAPEHRFPAASEDVAAVYSELLKRFRPENIGLYGCSAGGVLTAQALAWFQAHGLPRPGAAGILCAGMSRGGDSFYLGPVLSGSHPLAPDSPIYRALRLYVSEANPRDPLVDPSVSSAVLAKFPPTFFVSSSRDYLMSGATHAHLQLVKAGVEAQLYVWEGLEHAFMYDPRLPESNECYHLIVRFFDTHLGKTPRT